MFFEEGKSEQSGKTSGAEHLVSWGVSDASGLQLYMDGLGAKQIKGHRIALLSVLVLGVLRKRSTALVVTPMELFCFCDCVHYDAVVYDH